MKQCLYCGKLLTQEQRHNQYCSIECASEAKIDNKIKLWLEGKESGTLKDGTLSKTIRNYLLKSANYCCSQCGWNKINPTTGNSPLEIHHIDGNYLNNTIENLQVLCPNCHSLTSNYKALNNSERIRTQTRKNYCVDCGKEICLDSLRCRDCENKHRITDKPVTREELKNLIRSTPFTQIGKKYGLTDNGIKKWCISYNLPSKKKDINKYTDEEWANV